MRTSACLSTTALQSASLALNPELKKVGEVETAVGDVGSPEAGSPEAR